MPIFFTRAIALFLALSILTALAGCAAPNGGASSTLPPNGSMADSSPEPVPEPLPPSVPEAVRIGALKGPTGIGMAWLMDFAQSGEARHDYRFTLEGAPDAIQGRLVSGELDIAALPTNLAAVLYNKTGGEIRLIAVSRMRVLYVMSAPGVEINAVSDLKGKTLFTAGQGSTQEYVLDYLLRQNGLDPETDLKVEYTSEHAETVAQLLSGKCDAALLPQPFVVTAMSKNPDIVMALDVGQEWDGLSGGTELAMSCLVARDSFIREYPGAVSDFLEDYAVSAAFARENVDEAAALSGKFDVIPENVARQAIPYCGIDCLTGAGMKASADAYLAVLHAHNPQAVGGSLPDEGFYFRP